MKLHDKHLSATLHKGLFHIDFHQFMELEGKCNSIELSEELGMSLREINLLKQKIYRT